MAEENSGKKETRAAIISLDARLRIAVEGLSKERANVLFQHASDDGWITLAYLKEFPWHISAAWDGWMAGTKSAGVILLEKDGKGALILEGEIEFADGHRWRCTDKLLFEKGMIKIERRWKHLALKKQPRISLGLTLTVNAPKRQRVLIPGVLYNNNPGISSDRACPKWLPGAPFLVEEHRLPVPFVNLEIRKEERNYSVSLITIPGEVRDAEADDLWWSIGLDDPENELAILSTSGAVAAGGQKNVVYGFQGRFCDYVPYPTINAAIGAIYGKDYYIDLQKVEEAGYGFLPALWKSYEIFSPEAAKALEIDEVIELKTAAARSRYIEDEPDVAGFLERPALKIGAAGCEELPARESFVYGASGASLEAAYAILEQGIRKQSEIDIEVARKLVDFFVKRSPSGTPGLCNLVYQIEEKRWEGGATGGRISSRQFGEAIANLADVIQLADEGGLKTKKWRQFLKESADFLADGKRLRDEGVYPMCWLSDGSPDPESLPVTGNAHAVDALCRAGAVLDEKAYIEKAGRILEGYYELSCKNLQTPYRGAEQDSPTVDKESAIGFLKAALSLYGATEDRKFLNWAGKAADWILTFVYIYDVRPKKESALEKDFNSVGWSAASVSSHCVDVFAPIVEFVRLSRFLSEPKYRKLALMMFEAATQTIATKKNMWKYLDIEGEQGEMFFQTNWTVPPWDRKSWHGGFSPSSPFRVCAKFLKTAILLKTLLSSSGKK